MTDFLLSRRKIVAGTALATLGSKVAWGQAKYPNKPIKLIVGWPAGGGSDISARLITEGMGRRLGQPVVVENRAGASGAIGHSVAARSPADGYTLLYSTGDTHSLLPHLYKDPQFSIKDFVGVASMGLYPMGFAVHSSVPARNIAEFQQWVKATQKQAVPYGTAGTGSAGHVLGESMASMAKLDLMHVPFQGFAPMVQSLLGQQLVGTFAHVVAMDQHLRSGALRMIGVTARERLAAFPDVPTLVEQGIPLENGSWGGILVPAATPPDIVALLHTVVEESIAEPAAAEANRKFSTIVQRMPQAEFHQFTLKQNELWGKFVRDANIKIT